MMNEQEFHEAIESDPSERENYLVYADWLDESGEPEEANQMRRRSFLAPLELDEDNEPLRLAFADWLESRGEYEEAGRQRQWPAAKQWMRNLASSLNREFWDDEPERPYTYEELMDRFEALRDHDLEDHLTISFGCDETAMYEMYNHLDDFLIHWSTLTGHSLATLDRAKIGFRCAC